MLAGCDGRTLLSPHAPQLFFARPPRLPAPPSSHRPVTHGVGYNHVNPCRWELAKREEGGHRMAVDPTERRGRTSGEVVCRMDVGIDHNTLLKALDVSSPILRHK